MNRRNKWLLGFSIIYWVIVLIGIALFAASFQKVPLEHYGLKAYFFSPNVNSQSYIPGLYDVGVGYYFITIPSTKQYLLDNNVTVINKNLEKIVVKYSLVYRLNPNEFYNLYMQMGRQYTNYLIASINNIISSVFLTLKQSQSRITVQKQVIDAINNKTNTLSQILGSKITVQALWINQLQFPQQVEQGYQSSLSISDSYQNAYQTTQLEYQKTKIKARAVEQTLSLLKSKLKFEISQTYNTRFMQVLSTDLSAEQVRQTRMSSHFSMKRIWTVILLLFSIIIQPK